MVVKVPQTLQQLMPIAEIEALYPEHWILIDRPELDPWNRLVSGIAVFAHPDKMEVHRMIGELKLTKIALHCTRKDQPGRRYM